MTVKINPRDVTLVIFHANCADGLGAAWAANKALGSTANYWAAYHGDEPPDCSGEVVAVLDFCYKRPVMEQMVRQAKGVVVVDHHTRIMKEMQGCPGLDIRYDPDHSGAVLSWNYFHEKKPVPILLKYIEDRDLWNWDMEHAKEYCAGLDSIDQTFSGYDYAARNSEKIIAVGKPIVKFSQNIIDSVVKRAAPGHIKVPEKYSSRYPKGVPAMIVNECHRQFVSAAGNQMVEENNCIAVLWWFDHEDGKIKMSLRSNDKVGIDVSEIASWFGGGGHALASGMSWEGRIEDLFDFT